MELALGNSSVGMCSLGYNSECVVSLSDWAKWKDTLGNSSNTNKTLTKHPDSDDSLRYETNGNEPLAKSSDRKPAFWKTIVLLNDLMMQVR